jgi:uncharacterized delta-60 repeat protein
MFISGRRNAVRAVRLMAVIACFNCVAAAAGEVDPTFNAAAYGLMSGDVQVIKPQPDGKVLIGGRFTEVNGHAASGIARLNVDGTVDTGFNPPDFFSNQGGLGSSIWSIGVQADGKIVVGGRIYGADTTFKPGVWRLNANGSLDTSFFVQEICQVCGFVTVYDIGFQSDGKIILGGSFSFLPIELGRNLVRLNTDGTVDASFSVTIPDVKDIEVLADDKIIAVGGTAFETTPFIRKYNANGSTDAAFTQINVGTGHAEALRLLPDGRSLVGGRFTSLNGFAQGRISRINADGTMDLTFNQNNPGANDAIFDIDLNSDGKILIAGNFSTYNSTPKQRIAQLNTDGTLDDSFANSTIPSHPLAVGVNDVHVQSDGAILVGLSNLVQNSIDPLLRLETNGQLDKSFVLEASWFGSVRKVVRQLDGKVLIGGEFGTVNGIQRRSLARLETNASLDMAFTPYFNGLATAPVVTAIALQPDGKVLVAADQSIGLKRLNSDGSHDPSFVTNIFVSSVNDIVVLSNGQILVGGTFPSAPARHILRLNANGTMDDTFGPVATDGAVNKIFVQPDGKIFIGGAFNNIGMTVRGRIARLNADGSLDASFNPPGGANDVVNDLGLQADGKVVIGGNFSAVNGNGNVQKIGRLNSDGSLDTSFIQSANGPVLAVEIQTDGKILIGGMMSAVSSIPKNGIARLNVNGTLDQSFITHANIPVWDIGLEPDGSILIGGQFTKINGTSRVRVARLLNSAVPQSTLFDYDGDGKADISVFRPSENRWYVFRSSDSVVSQTVFAIPGDVPVPADYDGDLKTDVAIYRPSNGAWWYQSSQNGAQINVNWGGEAGDVPRPSDFDGDGKADFVFFRPTNSTWYRINSTGTISNLAFGLAGDKPVSGDFDGDGKSDVAIYRPSTGDWWYQSSINNAQLAVRWGISTDIPAPADFDGDGRTDFAVYRPSTGVWYVINSSNGSFLIGPFGTSEDKPVPADYDGDGRAELAVFRPSTGVWYQLRTNGGFFAMQFGISTDTPTPNAFVP